MESEFKKIARKIELYAEQAMVVSIDFNKASATYTQSTKEGVVVQNKTAVEPAAVQEEFLAALRAQKIPYEVIARDDNQLVFATSRAEDFSQSPIQKQVNDFFAKAPRALASGSQSYYQKYDSSFAYTDALLKPFSKTRREVSRIAKGLNAG
jgi:ABC-type enterochelin transport system substrate-binding protein